MAENKSILGAVLLAAGLSTRMGSPKMLLPWGKQTVIQYVIEVLLSAGLENIVVVTGGHKDKVDLILQKLPVTNVFNPNFADGEMLHSIQVGLSALQSSSQGAFIVLGDQPTISYDILTHLYQSYHDCSTGKIIIPSYQYRRGHPWIIPRTFWQQIYDLKSPQTLRDFLKVNEKSIHYVEVNSPAILQDIDTPQDYDKYRPK